MNAQKYEQLELSFMKEMNALNQTQNAIQGMLNLTWNNVLVNLTKPGTKELMRQHGKLIAIHNGEVWIKMSSPQLLRLVQYRISEVELAFQKAFGVSIKIHLEA
jgi:DNA polymerase-3 subunit gamma/tau